MSLLDRRRTLVENPLAAAHAFRRLSHLTAVAGQLVRRQLQPPLFPAVLLVFEFLEIPLPAGLLRPLGIVAVKYPHGPVLQLPDPVADPVQKPAVVGHH